MTFLTILVGRKWQWQEANRYVKRGSKAFHILVPYIKKVEVEGGEDKEALYGFGCSPVFRVEDTGGEPLDYQEIEVPELPLLERAEDWGITVKTICRAKRHVFVVMGEIYLDCGGIK